jgi:hypothetical protein
MEPRLTVGSGLHRLADALFALVVVIREGIAEDQTYRAELAEKRAALVALTDGTPQGKSDARG